MSEYIKKEDAIKAFEKSLLGKYILWDTQDKIKKDMQERISQLPTYSFPDSAEIKEIKEPTLLESFKDGADKVVEIWAVKGKLQIRTHGVIHNCNGTFGNDISVKSVNGAISVFPDSAENKGEDRPKGHCGADMRGKICNTCKNSDDEFSGECYECVKNIQNHYEPQESED